MKRNNTTRSEILSYIRKNWKTQTFEELAAGIGMTRGSAWYYCKKVGVKPITKTDRMVKIMRDAKGTMTAEQLAKEICRSKHTVWLLAAKYDIPLAKSPRGRHAHPKKKEIAVIEKRPVGRPRMDEQVIPAAIDEPKPFMRPRAVYSNPSYEDNLQRILNG